VTDRGTMKVQNRTSWLSNQINLDRHQRPHAVLWIIGVLSLHIITGKALQCNRSKTDSFLHFFTVVTLDSSWFKTECSKILKKSILLNYKW